jgi:hypothetical protein
MYMWLLCGMLGILPGEVMVHEAGNVWQYNNVHVAIAIELSAILLTSCKS